jgi:hypothetical protein
MKQIRGATKIFAAPHIYIIDKGIAVSFKGIVLRRRCVGNIAIVKGPATRQVSW